MSATITKEPSYNEMVDALASALGLTDEEVRIEKQRYVDEDRVIEQLDLDADQIDRTRGYIRSINLRKMGNLIADIRDRMQSN